MQHIGDALPVCRGYDLWYALWLVGACVEFAAWVVACIHQACESCKCASPSDQCCNGGIHLGRAARIAARWAPLTAGLLTTVRCAACIFVGLFGLTLDRMQVIGNARCYVAGTL
jgi:hypothetical protein